MQSIIRHLGALSSIADRALGKLHSIVSLLARLYVAEVFFSSGLTKIQDWGTTLFLFEEEYHVPLLPFELAAWLGTGAELILPVFLVLGLFTRFAALGLFVVNIVAVISLSDIPPAAYNLHVIWGLLLAHVVIYGAGVLSAGRLALRWLSNTETDTVLNTTRNTP